jgi:tight adherence protein C
MSNIAFLALGLACTFGAVVLLALAVDFTASERKEAVRVLQAQIGSSSSSIQIPNLREEQLSRSILRRALVPVFVGAGRAAQRFTPDGALDRYQRKLTLAGSPAGWDAERVAAFKIIGGVGCVVGSFFLTSTAGIAGFKQIGIIGLLTAVGWFGPDVILDNKVEARQKEIRRALPDTLDLLTISVEAGLSLNAAVQQVVRNVPGTLSKELARMLQEIQLGISRQDAFKALAERTDVDELNGFVLAMIQADVFGVSIANVLRQQSADLRIKRRQRAQEEAQKTPVKIVFPLVVCILPSLFVIVAGPGVIRIMQSLLHGGQ